MTVRAHAVSILVTFTSTAPSAPLSWLLLALFAALGAVALLLAIMVGAITRAGGRPCRCILCVAAYREDHDASDRWEDRGPRDGERLRELRPYRGPVGGPTEGAPHPAGSSGASTTPPH